LLGKLNLTLLSALTERDIGIGFFDPLVAVPAFPTLPVQVSDADQRNAIIIGCVVAGVALIIVAVLFIWWWKRWRQPTPSDVEIAAQLIEKATLIDGRERKLQRKESQSISDHLFISFLFLRHF